MPETSPSSAPTCTHCGRIYLEGSNGVCSACLQAERRPRRSRTYRKRRRALTCECGRPAVTVLLVKIGREDEGLQTVRMPLCQSCLQLEKDMWDEQGAA
jgi:predicted  nucleic acid-binding Zn-ribbon protein